MKDPEQDQGMYQTPEGEDFWEFLERTEQEQTKDT